MKNKTVRVAAEIIADLRELECRLSPENMSCDGELSMNEQQVKFTRLEGQWFALVKELGRYPTQGELIPELKDGAQKIIRTPGMCA